jgi:hypothetical protein
MAVLLTLLLTCWWCCAGGGVYFEMFRLRHFADHVALREAGRALIAQRGVALQDGQIVFIPITELPPALAALGPDAFVRIGRVEHTLHVEIDMGYYYGLSVWPEGARPDQGEVLIPGLTLWGHP